MAALDYLFELNVSSMPVLHTVEVDSFAHVRMLRTLLARNNTPLEVFDMTILHHLTDLREVGEACSCNVTATTALNSPLSFAARPVAVEAEASAPTDRQCGPAARRLPERARDTAAAREPVALRLCAAEGAPLHPLLLPLGLRGGGRYALRNAPRAGRDAPGRAVLHRRVRPAGGGPGWTDVRKAGLPAPGRHLSLPAVGRHRRRARHHHRAGDRVSQAQAGGPGARLYLRAGPLHLGARKHHVHRFSAVERGGLWTVSRREKGRDCKTFLTLGLVE